MAISIRLTEKEEKLFKDYARLNGITISDLVRNSVMAKIEDEYDLAIAEEAYEEYVKSGKSSRPIEELWEEMNL